MRRKNGRMLRMADMDDGTIVTLNEADSNWLSVLDDNVYYELPGGIVATNLKTGRTQSIANTPSASHIVADQRGVFYVSPNDKHSLNFATFDGERFVLTSSYTEQFSVAGDWVFYINADDDALWRVRIDGTESRPAS